MYCTYPDPLYAHTHFLPSVWAALVLDHVRAEALAASPLLRVLGVVQHLSYSLFVHVVKALGAVGKKVCAVSTQGSRGIATAPEALLGEHRS